MSDGANHDPSAAESHGEEAERELADAPHAVVAAIGDLERARVLIQDLEEHGVPPGSIGLLGAVTKDPEEPGRESDIAESDALGQVAKSAIAGGTGGAVVGGLLGGLATLVLPGVGLVTAAGLGAIFGAGVGGAAGGMSVVKYSSPAWSETYQTVEAGQVAVAVHHPDVTVVEAAEEIMRRSGALRVSRFDEGDKAGR